MVKIAVSFGLLFATFGFAQSLTTSSAQLFVDIRPEVVLAWQGDDAVLVKARLAPGSQARVWADEVCGAPTATAQVVSASGTVTIQLAAIEGLGKSLVCLSTSDGRLSASLPAVRN